MDGPGELPQWISYLGGVVGIIIASVVVRLGWVSKSDNSPSTHTENANILGAIVDSQSVRELSSCIEAGTHATNDLVDTVRDLVRETRVLSDEIRRSAQDRAG